MNDINATPAFGVLRTGQNGQGHNFTELKLDPDFSTSLGRIQDVIYRASDDSIGRCGTLADMPTGSEPITVQAYSKALGALVWSNPDLYEDISNEAQPVAGDSIVVRVTEKGVADNGEKLLVTSFERLSAPKPEAFAAFLAAKRA
jgi:hypothetical protein